MFNLLKKKLSTDIRISKIFMHDDFLCVKPQKGNFDMIYRAGMSVNWNKDLKCLYYTHDNADNEVKIETIKKAVNNEYGVNLFTDEKTKRLV
ncbi:MAG: hypothetical protein IJ435_08830 [Clostridia bacterium]|nr:hypothetical protein [Clostridia bacterium]